MTHYRLIISVILIVSMGLLVHAQITKTDEDEIRHVDQIAHTNTELGDAIRGYIHIDKQMNAAYKAVMAIYDLNLFHQTEGVKEEKAKLQAAQLAWLKYRDLAVKSEQSLYKSRRTYYWSLAGLTAQRTDRLKEMLQQMMNGRGSPDPLVKSAKEALDKLEKLDREQ